MYQLSAYVHLLAAIIWVGGMLFLAVVLVPIARHHQNPPGAGVRLLTLSARRFRVVAWAAFLILVATGIWNLLERGIGPSEILTGSGWLIQTLRVKMALVALVVILSAFHDFVLGPRLAREMEVVPGSPARAPVIQRQRRVVAWLARANLLLVLVIIALGVVIVRGIPWS